MAFEAAAPAFVSSPQTLRCGGYGGTAERTRTWAECATGPFPRARRAAGVEIHRLQKALCQFRHASPILGRTAAGETQQLAESGLSRRGRSGPISASFGDGRDIAGRERRERLRRNAGAAARVSQHEKGKKEQEVVQLPDCVDHISSPSNAYVKHLVRLRQSPKTRGATESVLVVGTVPLREICDECVVMVVDVLLVREDSTVPEELRTVSRRIVRVSSDAMSKLSGLDSPPELAGVLPFPPTFVAVGPHLDSSAAQVKMRRWHGGSPRRILVLDSIQDPGNLGTLLRTAAAFAWDGVFLLHGCCDPFNDKALRASRGASFRVPIGVGEWEHVRAFAIANELKLFAGDPDPGEKGSSGSSNVVSRFEMEDELKVALGDGQGLCLVLGSEGQGLSKHVTKDCIPIGIPMPGNFESLNVAVAGGILMFLLRSPRDR